MNVTPGGQGLGGFGGRPERIDPRRDYYGPEADPFSGGPSGGVSGEGPAGPGPSSPADVATNIDAAVAQGLDPATAISGELQDIGVANAASNTIGMMSNPAGQIGSMIGGPLGGVVGSGAGKAASMFSGIPSSLFSLFGLGPVGPVASLTQMAMNTLGKNQANAVSKGMQIAMQNQALREANQLPGPRAIVEEEEEAAPEGELGQIGQIGLNSVSGIGSAAVSDAETVGDLPDVTVSAEEAAGSPLGGIVGGNSGPGAGLTADQAAANISAGISPPGTVGVATAGGHNAPGTVADVGVGPGQAGEGGVGAGGVGGPGGDTGEGSGGDGGAGAAGGAPHKGTKVKKGSKPLTGGLRIGADEDRDGRRNVPAMLEEGETVVPAGKKANDAARRYKLGGMAVGAKRVR